jgi:hypothetical protein
MKFTENDLLDNEIDTNDTSHEQITENEIPFDQLVNLKFSMTKHVKFYSIPLLQNWNINLWIDFLNEF